MTDPETPVHPEKDSRRDRSNTSRRRRQKFSPITRRILAVNIFALAVLVVGLLYVGQYRQGLIDAEIAALTSQAELFAAALGESAVGAEGSERQHLIADAARQIVRRLSATTRTRAQLISTDKRLVTDSQKLTGPGGEVVVEELPPPSENGTTSQFFLTVSNKMTSWFRQPQVKGTDTKANVPVWEFSETKLALAGEQGSGVHLDDKGGMVLNVAVPVQRYKQVLGALTLSTDLRRIDEAVFQVRLDILKVFGVALLITVLLSVYLAGTIARPVRRLAVAAERVRRGLSRQYTIPDFAGRQDEIGDLGGALKDMTEALWDRMDAIEQFAADVAHEIKNPLTSLRSAVETAARVDDPAQQKKLMAIIQDDISRLDRLISDISHASRLDSELSRAELAPVDISAMLSNLVDMHQSTREKNDPEILFDGPFEGVLMVMGQEDQLIQVIRNLIGNAASFSPAGGHIRILASTQEDAADDGVKIFVEDNGPGIPSGMEEAIFERFYQERPADEKFGTHSGLGLSISKQIVEAHGGKIWAENIVMDDGTISGARFIIRLPQQEKSAAKKASEKKPGPAKRAAA
ncbi:MAG: sensor N-terminal transmembrane domain-containing protein [Proteobacteria bacterium]|nr:sensor N-terminal transmembrane domain-containing protein [Pseudomonadota bacterium]